MLEGPFYSVRPSAPQTALCTGHCAVSSVCNLEPSNTVESQWGFYWRNMQWNSTPNKMKEQHDKQQSTSQTTPIGRFLSKKNGVQLKAISKTINRNNEQFCHHSWATWFLNWNVPLTANFHVSIDWLCWLLTKPSVQFSWKWKHHWLKENVIFQPHPHLVGFLLLCCAMGTGCFLALLCFTLFGSVTLPPTSLWPSAEILEPLLLEKVWLNPSEQQQTHVHHQQQTIVQQWLHPPVNKRHCC